MLNINERLKFAGFITRMISTIYVPGRYFLPNLIVALGKIGDLGQLESKQPHKRTYPVLVTYEVSEEK